MSMIDIYLTDMISYSAPSTNNVYGDDSYSAAVNISARVEHKNVYVSTSKNGGRIESKVFIILTPTTPVDLGYKITIDSEDFIVIDKVINKRLHKIDNVTCILAKIGG